VVNHMGEHIKKGGLGRELLLGHGHVGGESL
jgi:hypothetical protein